MEHSCLTPNSTEPSYVGSSYKSCIRHWHPNMRRLRHCSSCRGPTSQTPWTPSWQRSASFSSRMTLVRAIHPFLHFKSSIHVNSAYVDTWLNPTNMGPATAGAADGVPLTVTLHTGKDIAVWPVLAGVEGDMPIQRLLCNGISHGGAHSCYRCALTGHWCPEARCMRCDTLTFLTIGLYRASCGLAWVYASVTIVSLTTTPPATAQKGCSFLSYWDSISQPVPARLDGTSHHPHVLDSGYSVPHGLLDVGAPPLAPRTRWTETPVVLTPATWVTTGVLKYTSPEMLLRGRTAAALSAQAGRTRSAAATDRDLKRLGVRGPSMFSNLSYFKCAPSSCAPHVVIGTLPRCAYPPPLCTRTCSVATATRFCLQSITLLPAGHCPHPVARVAEGFLGPVCAQGARFEGPDRARSNHGPTASHSEGHHPERPVPPGHVGFHQAVR